LELERDHKTNLLWRNSAAFCVRQGLLTAAELTQ
jgi:hypothetical protein